MPISSHCFWPCEERAGLLEAAILEPDDLQDLVEYAAPRRRYADETARRARRACRRARGRGSPRPRPSRTRSASGTCGRCRARGDRRLVEAREVVHAVEEHGARIGPRLAGDDVHHRGLARAVGADDGAHFALLDDEGEVAQRPEAVEGDVDGVEIEQRLGGCGLAACGEAGSRIVVDGPYSAGCVRAPSRTRRALPEPYRRAGRRGCPWAGTASPHEQ